jgi:hypothetical protein
MAQRDQFGPDTLEQLERIFGELRFLRDVVRRRESGEATTDEDTK